MLFELDENKVAIRDGVKAVCGLSHPALRDQPGYHPSGQVPSHLHTARRASSTQILHNPLQYTNRIIRICYRSAYNNIAGT